MKFLPTLILSLLLFSFAPAQAKTPSKEVHKEMHTKLLADAKSGIDKSILQDYLKFEVEARESLDPVFGDLSKESIDMIADLLEEAKSHSGKRYRSGAKGPNNFDCSGFTSYVYRQFGYSLNASSSAQYYDGEAINNSELRPGDLVFFTSPRSRGGVGHVGIVVEADNDNHTFSFIHAAVSGGIQVDKSTAPYYSKRYVGARRIITE